MSDYKRIKAVFYPLAIEDAKKAGIEDIDEEFDDIYEYGASYGELLEERFPDLFEKSFDDERDFFYTFITSDYEKKSDEEDNNTHVYLGYVLYRNTDAPAREFGRHRDLSDQEKEKYGKLFRKLIPDADVLKLRYVDFSWYDCCEPQDYYLKNKKEEREDRW